MKVIFLILLMYCRIPAYAGIYKWTDESGNVHYGDHPDSAVVGDQNKAVEMNVRMDDNRIGGMQIDRRKKRERMLQILEEDRLSREESRRKKYAEQRQRQQRCARIKDDLRRYTNANGVYHMDKNGERIYFTDQQRRQKENKLKKMIRKYCD